MCAHPSPPVDATVTPSLPPCALCFCSRRSLFSVSGIIDAFVYHGQRAIREKDGDWEAQLRTQQCLQQILYTQCPLLQTRNKIRHMVDQKIGGRHAERTRSPEFSCRFRNRTVSILEVLYDTLFMLLWHSLLLHT